MNTYEIRFVPDGSKVMVEADVTIMEAAQRVGIELNSFCGGVGTCNKCLVELADQAEPVKACQYHIDRNMTVTVPESSRFFEQKILQEGIDSEAKVAPLVCKHYLTIPEPSLDDLRSDSDRLIDAVNDQSQTATHCRYNHNATASDGSAVDWALLGRLPGLFRQHNYDVTAVCNSGRVFAIEPGDTAEVLYGVAVDVGTTTVVAGLVDLISAAPSLLLPEAIRR